MTLTNFVRAAAKSSILDTPITEIDLTDPEIDRQITNRLDAGRHPLDDSWTMFFGPVVTAASGRRYRLLWQVPTLEGASPDAHREAILDAEVVWLDEVKS